MSVQVTEPMVRETIPKKLKKGQLTEMTVNHLQLPAKEITAMTARKRVTTTREAENQPGRQKRMTIQAVQEGKQNDLREMTVKTTVPVKPTNHHQEMTVTPADQEVLEEVTGAQAEMTAVRAAELTGHPLPHQVAVVIHQVRPVQIQVRAQAAADGQVPDNEV